MRLLPYATAIARRFGSDDEFESEAYVALCEGVATWPGNGEIKNWVGVVVKNRLAGMLRRTPHITNHDVDIAYKPRADVHSAIDRLPTALKVALVARYVEEKTLPEVALALGISVHRARAKLRQGRAALRKALDDIPMTEGLPC